MTRVGSVVAAALARGRGHRPPASSVAPGGRGRLHGADGVTVVVDSAQPAGLAVADCVRRAAATTRQPCSRQPGTSLERVQRLPGAICRVDGKPAGEPVRQHAADQRLLGPVLVQRHVGGWVVLQRGRRRLDDPRGRVGRVRVAGQQLPAQPRGAAPPDHDASEPGDRRRPTGPVGTGGGNGGGTGGSTGRTAAATSQRRHAVGIADRLADREGAGVGARAACPRPGSRSRSRGVGPGSANEESESAEPTDDATVLPTRGEPGRRPASDAAGDGGLPLWLVGPGRAAACCAVDGRGRRTTSGRRRWRRVSGAGCPETCTRWPGGCGRSGSPPRRRSPPTRCCC